MMPIYAIFVTSAVTGVFCAIFAVIVDVVTDALELWMVVVLAFVSGFLGSLCAQFLMKRTT